MNTVYRYLILLLASLGFGAGSLHAQTFNWGSAVFSDLVDSNGNTLDDSFIFEVGAFTEGFVPTAENAEFWFDHWQAFDDAAYNGVEEVNDDGIYGYFTSTAQMTTDGTSSSTGQTPGAISFEGLNAYMWIRNANVAQPGSEWSLTRADSWFFPAADPDCCGNDLPIEWSTSDLVPTYVPVWGTQAGMTGGGVITNTGTYTLQTATFTTPVPEPSTFFLTLLAGNLLIFLRRR
ncbi:MAG: PEP-CTERM sorting domain-containing protein [Luteolibacter sp.]